jgi:hypothetical protein
MKMKMRMKQRTRKRTKKQAKTRGKESAGPSLVAYIGVEAAADSTLSRSRRAPGGLDEALRGLQTA